MQINDYLQHANESARSTKEWTCRKRPADINPFISVYRADELIGLITLRNHNRDEILQVASMCAAGFDADILCLVFETYVADCKMTDEGAGENPLTGKRWGPGEMQDVAQNHQGIEKGWVTEALLITVVNRAGDVVAMNQSFRYSGKHLVWEEDTVPMMGMRDDGTPGPEIQGIVPDALRHAMNRKSAAQAFPDGWAGGADRADRDIMTAQLLGANFECAPMLVALADDNSRVRKLRKVGITIGPGGVR